MARIGVRLETGPHMSPADLRDLATLAESRSYESLWLPEGGVGDALTQLAALATSTSRIRLGTGILPIFSRTPTLTAMSTGWLDAISGGRFVLGLGVGHRPSVEGGHGVPFRSPMTRMRETVDIVRRLLRGETVTSEGRAFNPQGASLGFEPLRPNPPIYLAALGPRMIELAGEIADGALITWASPRYLPQAKEALRRGAQKAGRDPDSVDLAGYVRTVVVDDPEEAQPALQRQIAWYFRLPYYKSFFEGMGFEKEAQVVSQAMAKGDQDAAAAAVSPEMVAQLAVAGTVEHCRREIESRRSLGLDLPVVAPSDLAGDPVRTFRTAIEAFSGNE